MFDGAMHCTLAVVLSIRTTECAGTLENGKEQVQSFKATTNENDVTIKVSSLPPYALTEVGDTDARDGASEASNVNENVAFPTVSSRTVQITCDSFGLGIEAGSNIVTNDTFSLTGRTDKMEAFVRDSG